MSMNGDVVWRALPECLEIREGIDCGRYSVKGGVIRHAKGTELAGAIKAHLRFPTDQQQSQDRLRQLQESLSSAHSGIDGMQESLQMIKGLQVANLALAGANLAVSAAGFAIVCSKLDQITGIISQQSSKMDTIVELAQQARNRSFLVDATKFIALTRCAQQFSKSDKIPELHALVLPFYEQYEFTKQLVVAQIGHPTLLIDRLPEIAMLQERLVHIALAFAHLQMRIGEAKHGEEVVREVEAMLARVTRFRVEELVAQPNLMTRIPKKDAPELLAFLRRGSEIAPALTYEADLLQLETMQPLALSMAPADSDQVLVLVAA